MNRQITLDKTGLANIMIGAVIAQMKDATEPVRQAMYDNHIASYKKAAQDIINKNGEPEAPKIIMPG